MDKRKAIIVAVAVVAVAIPVLVILLAGDDKGAIGSSAGSSTGSAGSTAQAPADDSQYAAIITYNGTEFFASATNIKVGEWVKVVNNSQQELDFDSDPHPVHTDNTEFNL